ncbi:hypothetical protein K440DRAFT_628321 [Wilcoxina mikolae CBS 423.85]|nr:hypothetical protein K440DRAFT_628321 [Wilcoxina mikolae CBS 423.85]
MKELWRWVACAYVASWIELQTRLRTNEVQQAAPKTATHTRNQAPPLPAYHHHRKSHKSAVAKEGGFASHWLKGRRPRV